MSNKIKKALRKSKKRGKLQRKRDKCIANFVCPDCGGELNFIEGYCLFVEVECRSCPPRVMDLTVFGFKYGVRTIYKSFIYD